MTQQNQQSLDVSKSLEVLCKKNEKCSSKLQAFLAKQVCDAMPQVDWHWCLWIVFVHIMG